MKRKINLQTLMAPAALIVLVIFFSITGKNFFSVDAVRQVLQSC